jgi:hypothetical protein
VGFRFVLIFSILVSAGLGGAWAHFGSGSSVGSVGEVTAGASDLFRNTMRKFDARYYTRGPDYGTCMADYGRNVLGKTNAEVVLSCECFDKSMRLLGEADRASAIDALRPNPPAAAAETAEPGAKVASVEKTIAAQRVLRKCDIDPSPDGFLVMRGTM